MDITQSFYDSLAPQYDRLYADWPAETKRQAAILDAIFRAHGFDRSARVLDCACGIGTQTIGLAALGYAVTGSDISDGALGEAKRRAEDSGVAVDFRRADFCALGESFSERFPLVIAMDNALPHMLSVDALRRAVTSIANRLLPGGLFVASIRDYDRLLETRPPYSPPYIHSDGNGRRVAFQTWDWQGENYRLTQYLIADGESFAVSRFSCEYRATRREELTALLRAAGCDEVSWLFPEETGFFQPIVTARKNSAAPKEKETET